jgi:hypothetical protein
MQSVAETRPSERYLLLTARFSARGLDAVRAWVEDRLPAFHDRPLDQEPIDRFRGASLTDHVVLMSLYAYADIPVGEAYDLAFSLDVPGPPESAHLVLEHVVWEFGIPVASVGHGHKHVLVFRASASLPPVLAALPELHDVNSTPFHARAGLSSSRDWGAIRNRELISVLREARELLARRTNDFCWSPWEDQEQALREVDSVIGSLQAGDAVDLGLIRVFFLPTGPIQEVSLSSGWGEEFIRLADRADAALARADSNRAP